MNRKSRLLKILNICIMVAMIFGGMLPAAAPMPRAQAQAEPLPGDITGDGVVDGRDALRIMRVVAGYETATPEEVARGDVYPLPGTDGRLVGDGQLTPEDAEKILRQTVGLVSEGEVTGDYGDSWPVVTRFEPLRGPAGTQITIYGENFIAGSPGENVVYIGESLAPVVSSTGTVLVVTVPAGALSGHVRVSTPAGEGSSMLDFTVMVGRAGKLNPPAGLNPSDFSVTNSVGDKAQPDANGVFTIPTNSYGVTMQMALPDGEGDERILMNVDAFGGQTVAAQAANAEPPPMDLTTTAQSMVYLSPYLASEDVASAEATLAVIASDPQVQALADLLGQLYAETETPVDDPRFDEAYLRAVESVLDRLPADMVIDLGAASAQNNDSSTVAPPPAVLDLFAGVKAGDVQYFHLEAQSSAATSSRSWQWVPWTVEDDFTYTKLKGSSQPGQIIPSVESGNPVDWIVQLAEVDDIYNVFPQGNVSLIKFDPRQVLPRRGYPGLSGARADSSLRYLDLFGVGYNAAWGALGQAIASAAPGLNGALTPTLRVDPDKDAIYVVRAYSGMLGDGADPGEFDFVYDELPEGRTMFLAALGQNIAWAAIDLVSVAIYMRNIDKSKLEEAIQKGIERAMVRSPKSLSPAAGAELCLSVANQVVHDVFAVLARSTVGIGISKVTLKIIGKSLNPLKLLYKVSTGAQAVERLAALIGLNQYMSPVETWIIEVGEPFVPQVTRLEPEQAKPGEIVTLFGRNFDSRAATNNEVRLGSRWPNAAPAEVLDVNSNGTQMRILIPEAVPAGETAIWVKVAYRVTPHMQTVTLGLPRVPHVRSLERNFGFAPYEGDSGPFVGYRGTLVVMNTENMIPLEGETQDDQVVFGGVVGEIDALNSTPAQIVARVPQMAPGATELYIYAPEYDVESNRLPFTVLDAPQVTKISPAQGGIGSLMKVEGDFGPLKSGGEIKVEVKNRQSGETAELVPLSVSADELAFSLPDLLEPGQNSASLEVVVWTPAGPSGALSVIARKDVEPDIDPDRPDNISLLAGGYNIMVEDPMPGLNAGGKVSLQEAVAFASGAINPFEDPWDEKDQIFEWTWNERIVPGSCHEDEQGQEVCSCYYDEEPDRKKGPLYSYHEGNYDIVITQGHPGGEKATYFRRDQLVAACHGGEGGLSDPYLYKTEGLDGAEEGEHVNCNTDYVRSDCPEEGDYVSYKDANIPLGGHNYSEQIEIGDYEAPNRTFAADFLSFGPADTLHILANDRIRVSGSVILSDQVMITDFDAWQSGPIIISGHNNVIRGSDMQAGDLEIRGSGNSISVDNLHLTGDVTIGAGNYNTLSAGEARIDGAVKMTDSAWNSILGNTLEIGGGIEITGQGDNSISATATPCKITEAFGTGIALNDTFSNHIDCDITNAGGRGVLLQGGGWNSVTGDMTKVGSGVLAQKGTHNSFHPRTASVTQLKGPVITMIQGVGNTAGLNARCSKGGEGVKIVGGRNNEAGGSISNCAGFLITGGIGNSVGGSYQGQSNPAVVLENTVLSSAAVEVPNGHGVGGRLVGDVSYSGMAISGCGMTTGIQSSGAGQHHNWLRFNSANCGRGPSQVGIKVENGSHHNTIDGVVYKAGGDGIYLSGGVHDTLILADATDNQGYGIYLGSTSNTEIRGTRADHNGRDGIHISTQASNTSVTGYASVSGNQGNGITVLGVGATVAGAYVGRNTSGINPNQGYGIFVDSVPSFEARYVSMGENCAGGLFIQDVRQTPAPGQATPVLVDLEHIQVQRGDAAACADIGAGVEFTEVSDVWAYDVKTSGYLAGVVAQHGARYAFKDVSAHDNSTDGFVILDLQDAELHIQALNNGGKGIAVVGSKNITMGEDTDQTMNPLYANDNGAAGLDITDSQNVVAVWGQFQGNGGPGIAIAGSQDVAIFHPQAEDNQAPGITIQQSRGVEIASGFEMEMPTMIQHNAGAGINITNAQDVTFSSGWRALHPHWPRPTVGFNQGPGILIEGEETNGVTIAGWTIQGNEDAGIQVENGPSNVLIGDFEGGYANLITENPGGIIAQGADTDIVIANNHIWEQTPPTTSQSQSRSAPEVGGDSPAQGVLELAGDGVILYNGLQQATVTGNMIESNADVGIGLLGANHNFLLDNTLNDNPEGIVIADSFFDDSFANQISYNHIRQNQGAGVVVSGSGANGNTISQNSITQNAGKGISLENGGNDAIPAPVIERISHRGTSVSGRVEAPDGSVVELFSDRGDEGASLLGTTTVTSKHFALNVAVPQGMNLHATVTHPNGDTSEFGPAQLTEPPKGAFAFTSTRDGNREIYLMDASLAASHRLTTRADADFSPRLCAAGTEVIFVSDAPVTTTAASATGSTNIWSVQSDGSDLKPITQGGGALDPACMPGGDQVVYTANGDLFTFPLQGGGGGGEEIAYDNGEMQFDDGLEADAAWGEHFTIPVSAQARGQTTETLSQLKFYIGADPAPFRWQVYAWENNWVGALLAEGETTPADSGWHEVPVHVEVGLDFVVAMHYVQDMEPKLGFASDGTGLERALTNYNDGSGWHPLYDYNMIRASFGTGGTPLLKDEANNRQPDWCADGSQIAFTSDHSGNDDIWVIDADGSHPRQITGDPAPDYSPVFSPDCTRIAFVSERDGNPDIYLIAADGTNPTRFTTHPAADTDPAWLPNDQELLFVSNRDAGNEIYAMTTSGAALTRLTNSLGDNTEPDAGAATASALGAAAVAFVSDGPARLSLPAVSVQAGETFTVPVTLAGAQNLGYLGFEIDYPDGNLTLVDILPGAMLAGSLYAINPESTAVQTGVIRFGWLRADGFAGGGALLQLVFRAEPLAYGLWPLTFPAPAAVDVALSELELEVDEGQVDVPSPATPTPTITPTPTLTPTPTVTPTPFIRQTWLPLVQRR